MFSTNYLNSTYITAKCNVEDFPYNKSNVNVAEYYGKDHILAKTFVCVIIFSTSGFIF